MTPTQPLHLTSLDGRRATLPDASVLEQGEPVLLHLEDGRRMMVPVELLEKLPDGTYRLLLDLSRTYSTAAGNAVGHDETLVVLPVTQEELTVRKRTTDAGGVRVTTHVQSEER